MRKLSIPFAFTLTLLLILTVAPASASSPPLAVHIEAPMVIPEEGAPYGYFTASGPAVDAGLLCPSGYVYDAYTKASGYQSQTGVNLQVVHIFYCDDGSGDFAMKLQVRLDGRGDKFNWTIVGGIGAYEKLHGTGSGTGLPIPGGVLDLYDGKVHID